MPRWLGLAPAHSRNCRAEWLSQSILETSAPLSMAVEKGAKTAVVWLLFTLPLSLLEGVFSQNGPQRSRARRCCAAKRTLHGEDRSEILDKRERGGPKWTAKMAQSLTASDTPPNSANWNWSAQSGIQSGDASSATLARAALCACRSCPSLDATSAPGETQRLSGAETSATPDADADRDIHQSPCHSTPAVPQTAWWCHCACSRASSYRTGLFSAAALAASDLTLEFDSFHPHIAPAPCQAGSYTTPPHRSASLGISHPATA